MRDTYRFVQVGEDDQILEGGAVVEYPRVSKIVNRVVAKPELIGWAYWRTVDNISGLIDTAPSLGDLTTMQTLSDASTLDEWLRRNRMRPEDVSGAAADRGQLAHDLLAGLAEPPQGLDVEEFISYHRGRDLSPFEAGVLNWWEAAAPHVVMSERVVGCTRHAGGFFGRLDLVVDNYVASPKPLLVDLKTRGKDEVYATDVLQLNLYAHALVDEGLDVDAGVLVVTPAGAQMHPVELRPEIVVPILVVDEFIRKGGESKWGRVSGTTSRPLAA